MSVGLFLITVAAPLAFIPSARNPFADPKLLLVAAGALMIWRSRPLADRPDKL